MPDLAAEEERSWKAVWHEGISHEDKRVPNMLWNEERRRVMVIDFDQAVFRPAAKHKQLSTLSGNGEKRKRRGCSTELHSQKRAKIGSHLRFGE